MFAEELGKTDCRSGLWRKGRKECPVVTKQSAFSGPVCRAAIAKIPCFSLVSATTQQSFSALQTVWRRERDSNPRYGFPYSSFQDWRLQPLGHLSAPTTVLLQPVFLPRPIRAMLLHFPSFATRCRKCAAVFKTACFNHSHIPPREDGSSLPAPKL